MFRTDPGFLFNRKPEDAAFLDDLIEAHAANPNYTFVGTMTQMEKSNREWAWGNRVYQQSHAPEIY